MVSERTFSELSAQVADAENFLSTHMQELERLSLAPGLTDLTLDFAIEARSTCEFPAQFDRLSSTLVRLAGHLGAAIEISRYITREE